MCWEYKPTQFVKIMILQKLICCPDKIDIIIGYKNPVREVAMNLRQLCFILSILHML